MKKRSEAALKEHINTYFHSNAYKKRAECLWAMMTGLKTKIRKNPVINHDLYDL